MKKYQKVIFYKLNFFNGNLFYAFEYFEYLRKNNWKLIIDLNGSLKDPFKLPINKKILFEAFREKYSKKYHNLFTEIIFLKPSTFFVADKILVLDQTSIKYLNKTFVSKKIIYNYGDDERSLKDPLNNKNNKNNKNIITIGDKDIGCKIQYHYPLKLNFKILKRLNYKRIQKRSFLENKTKNIYERKRNVKDFHYTFDTLIYKKENFWERANRLIPECKFYNKEIIFENKDKRIDSANLRYQSSWKDYSLYHSDFKDFVENL